MKQKIRTALPAYSSGNRADCLPCLRQGSAVRIPLGHKASVWLICTQKKSSSVKITLLLKVDLEGFEPLTSRMRTERSPMRTLKKPPKNRTFLCETAKKYRRNAGFQTSITFEKKLPFLLQCEKVTLQEGCASDAIWTGDHLNTSCGSRTVWGWFGLYPLYNTIDEKQLDFFWLFLFYCTNRQKQCRRLRTQRRWNCPKKVIKYRVALYKI